MLKSLISVYNQFPELCNPWIVPVMQVLVMYTVYKTLLEGGGGGEGTTEAPPTAFQNFVVLCPIGHLQNNHYPQS